MPIALQACVQTRHHKWGSHFVRELQRKAWRLGAAVKVFRARNARLAKELHAARAEIARIKACAPKHVAVPSWVLCPGEYKSAKARLLLDVPKVLRLAFTGGSAPAGAVAEMVSDWTMPVSRRTVERCRARVARAALWGIENRVAQGITGATRGPATSRIICLATLWDETPMPCAYFTEDGQSRSRASVNNVVESLAVGPVRPYCGLDAERSCAPRALPIVVPPFLSPSTAASDVYNGLLRHSAIERALDAVCRGGICILATCADSAASNFAVAVKLATDMKERSEKPHGQGYGIAMHTPCLMHLLHLVVKDAMPRSGVQPHEQLRIANHLQLGRNVERMVRKFQCYRKPLIVESQAAQLIALACGVGEGASHEGEGPAERKFRRLLPAARKCFRAVQKDGETVADVDEAKVLDFIGAYATRSRIPRPVVSRWTDMAFAAQWWTPLLAFADMGKALAESVAGVDLQTPKDMRRADKVGLEKAVAEATARKTAMMAYARSDAFLADNLIVARMPHMRFLQQLLQWKTGLFGLRRAARQAQNDAARMLRGEDELSKVLRQLWRAGAHNADDWAAYEGKRRVFLVTLACGMRERFAFLEGWPYRLLDLVEGELEEYAQRSLCEEFLSATDEAIGGQSIQWRAFVHRMVPAPSSPSPSPAAISRRRVDFMLGSEFRAMVTRWARRQPVTVVESESRHARSRRAVQVKFGRPKLQGTCAMQQCLQDILRLHSRSFADRACDNANEEYLVGRRRLATMDKTVEAMERDIPSRTNAWNLFQKEHGGQTASELRSAWAALTREAKEAYRARAAEEHMRNLTRLEEVKSLRDSEEGAFKGPWCMGDKEFPVSAAFLSQLDVDAKHEEDANARDAWLQAPVERAAKSSSTMMNSAEWTDAEKAALSQATPLLPSVGKVSHAALELLRWVRTHLPCIAPAQEVNGKRKRARYDAECIVMWNADGRLGAFEITRAVNQRQRLIGCPLVKAGSSGSKWAFVFSEDRGLECCDIQYALEDIVAARGTGTSGAYQSGATPQWPRKLLFAFVRRQSLMARKALKRTGVAVEESMIQWTQFRADWQCNIRRSQRPECDVARNMWREESLTESDASDLGDARDAARSSGGAHSRGELDALVHRASRRYRAEAERAVETELEDMLETEILPHGASIATPGLHGDSDGGANEADPGTVPNRGGGRVPKKRKVAKARQGLPVSTDELLEAAPWYRPPPAGYFTLKYNAVDHRYIARWAPAYKLKTFPGRLHRSKTHVLDSYGGARVAGTLCFLWMWNALARETTVESAEAAFSTHGGWGGLLHRVLQCIDETPGRNMEAAHEAVRAYQQIRAAIYAAQLRSGLVVDSGANLSDIPITSEGEMENDEDPGDSADTESAGGSAGEGF